MTIRTILVPMPHDAVDEAAIGTALNVTRAVDGHLDALYIQAPLPTGGGVPAGGYEMPRGGVGVAEQVEARSLRAAEERERAAEQTRQRLERLAAAHGVRMTAPDDHATRPSVSWHEADGSQAAVVTARAPASDLLIVPSPSDRPSILDIAEQTLLSTGRPVLLAPAREAADPTRSAMIAWQPSLQAWRAVAAAVPLLEKAGSAEIVTVGEESEAVATSRAEVVRYLGWHGIEATARNIVPASSNIGDALLGAAGEAQAGMLVMGAYSHSRLRELLLGGVTRHVLTHAAATPVLMAH